MICEYCDQGVHLSCLSPVPDKRPKVRYYTDKYATVRLWQNSPWCVFAGGNFARSYTVKSVNIL